jgi:hypothetical protein
VSNKRFTDSKKWKDEWFLELPVKAKLAWLYLCDDCELTGVWKINYKLASYQLGFTINAETLAEWFQDRIHFFDKDKILIVKFFEFQYGESKDTWSAKVKAKSLLEQLGFKVENNKVIIPSSDHSTPTVGVESKSLLIEGIEESRDAFNKGGSGEKLPELAEIWNLHCGDLPKVIGTNKERNKRIKARMEEASADKWVEVIQRIAKSDFCNNRGPSAKGWKADFDFLLQPETRLKVLEGKYDNRDFSQPIKKTSHENVWLIEAENLLQAVKKFGPDEADKIQVFLGDVRFEWFKKIGRRRISEMPANEYSKKDLAKLIQSVAEQQSWQANA